MMTKLTSNVRLQTLDDRIPISDVKPSTNFERTPTHNVRASTYDDKTHVSNVMPPREGGEIFIFNVKHIRLRNSTWNVWLILLDTMLSGTSLNLHHSLT